MFTKLHIIFAVVILLGLGGLLGTPNHTAQADAVIPTPAPTQVVQPKSDLSLKQTTTDYTDDFSSYAVQSPPTGWTQYGESTVIPKVIYYGGQTTNAFKRLEFPSYTAGTGERRKWLIKDGFNWQSINLHVKLNFQTNSDGSGAVIAWRDENNFIAVLANPFWDEIVIWEFVNGQPRAIASSGRGSVPIETNRDYWLNVDTFPQYMNQKRYVDVYWSTNNVDWVAPPNLFPEEGAFVTLNGQVGVGTYQTLSRTLFDDFLVYGETLADNAAPNVDWLAPVSNDQTYYVNGETVQLKVNARDNIGISKVNFSRWDPITERDVNLGDVVSSIPQSLNLDSRTLNYGYNQITALAYDLAGNATEKSIWLYRNFPTCPNQYVAAYYKNSTLAGDPVFVQCENWPINYQWGMNNPTPAIQDVFSVRWTSQATIQAGTYDFIYKSDDGMRVYLNDQLIINNWDNPSLAEGRVAYSLNTAEYNIRVEYYDSGGGAVAQFKWEKKADTTFQVNPDGFSFPNFTYNGASWEQFKKAFPGSSMELSNGTRRKGAQLFFNTEYTSIGEGGNCAGFTAASLIRYLHLPETVESSLLSADHQKISSVYDLPSETDVKDYIHLYQARQVSYEYGLWWGQHWDDTPLQSYQAIKAKTQAGEPVAASIWQVGRGGHRVTAYRTEENGNTGYIYIYDNNWPNDSSRRIELNLTTGRWSYTLWQGEVWGGTTNLRYSLASTNFPAALPPQYQNRLFPTEASGETMVNVEGQAQLLITDAQGRKLGFANGNFVSEIPGAAFIPIDAYNPDDPNAAATESFFLPSNTSYQITIQPISNGAYDLVVFGNGSGLLLGNISAATNAVDTLTLNGNVLDTTFKPATDQDFCHYITRDVSNTVSRDFNSCISGSTGIKAQFSLDAAGNNLQFRNQSNQPVTLNTTVDQVGDGASNNATNQQVPAGQSITIQAGKNKVYLPIVVK